MIKVVEEFFSFLGSSFLILPEVSRIQILLDALIAIACFLGLPFAFYFFWKRGKEVGARLLIIFFCGTLLAFGSLNVIGILSTLGYEVKLQIFIKGAAALLSIATAMLLIPLLPKSLEVTSNQLLEDKDKEIEFANDKYDLLLESSGVGIYEWQNSELKPSRLLWSTRMFELLGFQANSFDPTVEFFLSLLHPEDREDFEEFLRTSIPGEEIEPMEYQIRVRNEYRWFRARRVSKLDPLAKIEFIIGSLEDIHDQKMTQEKIRSMNLTLEDEISKRTLQLELANKAKTRFLANMSHEMRTPLGLVLGFSDLLLENTSLDAEAKEYVELISKNGEILARVINDLLDLSKIEAGKLRFQYSKVSLKTLIDDFQKAFEERALNKGISLQFENQFIRDEFVVTDEIRLKQIVYNLLSNAIKFTDRGYVRLIQGKTGSHYFIDVIDSGIGIPDSDKGKLFQEYVRGDVADSSKTSGTGLGLRLAQNLAQALGGKVELLTTQIGKGSHFRMTFVSDELKLQQQNEKRQEAVINTKLSSFDIFVLDDNEDNIRLAEIFLRKLGCRVRGFTSPKTFFAEMASSDPDLILLDINMPEMSGFEVFDRLRDMKYEKPIWALTAYSLNEDIQAIMDHGFDDYIRKPLSADLVKRKLAFELKEKVND